MNGSWVHTVLVIMLASAVLGCAGGDDGGGSASGVESAVLPRTAPPLRLLHLASSATQAEFGLTSAVVADRAGNVYVADGQARQIVVLDPGGSPVGTMGRRGSGPGEFASLTDLAWHGDTLVALDFNQRRLTLFDPAGRVVATRPWPEEAGRPLGLFTVGGLAHVAGTFSRRLSAAPVRSAAEGAAMFRQPEVRYARLGPTGIESATTAIFDTVVEPRGFDCDAANGRIAIFSVPFFGRAGPLRAFTATGHLAMASRAAYRVAIVDTGSGDTVRTVARDYPLRPVTDADWATETAAFREREHQEGPFACDIADMRPQHFPVIRSIVSDERGRLWIEAAAADGGHVLAAFDSLGRLLGEAPLPDRYQRVPIHIRNDHLYLVTVDELGVQAVQSYRLLLEEGER